MPSSCSQGRRARLSSRKFATVPATSGMRPSIGPRIRLALSTSAAGVDQSTREKTSQRPTRCRRVDAASASRRISSSASARHPIRGASRGPRRLDRARGHDRGGPASRACRDRDPTLRWEGFNRRSSSTCDALGHGPSGGRPSPISGSGTAESAWTRNAIAPSDRGARSAGPEMVSETAWWTLVPAGISTGKGNRRGVQKVLNEPSIQFRWSSVSNTSPSNRSSAQSPGTPRATARSARGTGSGARRAAGTRPLASCRRRASGGSGPPRTRGSGGGRRTRSGCAGTSSVPGRPSRTAAIRRAALRSRPSRRN